GFASCGPCWHLPSSSQTSAQRVDRLLRVVVREVGNVSLGEVVLATSFPSSELFRDGDRVDTGDDKVSLRIRDDNGVTGKLFGIFDRETSQGRGVDALDGRYDLRALRVRVEVRREVLRLELRQARLQGLV